MDDQSWHRDTHQVLPKIGFGKGLALGHRGLVRTQRGQAERPVQHSLAHGVAQRAVTIELLTEGLQEAKRVLGDVRPWTGPRRRGCRWF